MKMIDSSTLKFFILFLSMLGSTLLKDVVISNKAWGSFSHVQDQASGGAQRLQEKRLLQSIQKLKEKALQAAPKDQLEKLAKEVLRQVLHLEGSGLSSIRTHNEECRSQYDTFRCGDLKISEVAGQVMRMAHIRPSIFVDYFHQVLGFEKKDDRWVATRFYDFDERAKRIMKMRKLAMFLLSEIGPIEDPEVINILLELSYENAAVKAIARFVPIHHISDEQLIAFFDTNFSYNQKALNIPPKSGETHHAHEVFIKKWAKEIWQYPKTKRFLISFLVKDPTVFRESILKSMRILSWLTVYGDANLADVVFRIISKEVLINSLSTLRGFNLKTLSNQQLQRLGQMLVEVITSIEVAGDQFGGDIYRYSSHERNHAAVLLRENPNLTLRVIEELGDTWETFQSRGDIIGVLELVRQLFRDFDLRWEYARGAQALGEKIELLLNTNNDEHTQKKAMEVLVEIDHLSSSRTVQRVEQLIARSQGRSLFLKMAYLFLGHHAFQSQKNRAETFAEIIAKLKKVDEDPIPPGVVNAWARMIVSHCEVSPSPSCAAALIELLTLEALYDSELEHVLASFNKQESQSITEANDLFLEKIDREMATFFEVEQRTLKFLTSLLISNETLLRLNPEVLGKIFVVAADQRSTKELESIRRAESRKILAQIILGIRKLKGLNIDVTPLIEKVHSEISNPLSTESGGIRPSDAMFVYLGAQDREALQAEMETIFRRYPKVVSEAIFNFTVFFKSAQGHIKPAHLSYLNVVEEPLLIDFSKNLFFDQSPGQWISWHLSFFFEALRAKESGYSADYSQVVFDHLWMIGFEMRQRGPLARSHFKVIENAMVAIITRQRENRGELTIEQKRELKAEYGDLSGKIFSVLHDIGFTRKRSELALNMLTFIQAREIEL